MGGMFFNALAFNQPLKDWNVAKVTNMGSMFSGASAFNQPIGNWNVAEVTTMSGMFYYASAFNQPLGDWNVDEVTDMRYMFLSASAFNQDLGWCVDDDVSLSNAFYGTPCELTSCGVTQEADCGAPTPAPFAGSPTSATCTTPHEVEAHGVL